MISKLILLLHTLHTSHPADSPLLHPRGTHTPRWLQTRSASPVSLPPRARRGARALPAPTWSRGQPLRPTPRRRAKRGPCTRRGTGGNCASCRRMSRRPGTGLCVGARAEWNQSDRIGHSNRIGVYSIIHRDRLESIDTLLLLWCAKQRTVTLAGAPRCHAGRRGAPPLHPERAF